MSAVPARQTPYTIGEEVLRYLGLDPRAPEVQALVLLCERYALDPVLGHAEIIGNRGKFEPYITRDGYLEVAHRSGQLDGIVVDEQRRNSSGDGWTTYVSVWRKDMQHPFRYGAQCKDTEPQAKAGHGLDQSLARAERRALKRAFNVTAPDPTDPGDQEIIDARDPAEFRFRPMEDTADLAELDVQVGTIEAAVLEPDAPLVLTQSEAHAVIGSLPKAQQLDFLAKHKIADFGLQWPPAALEDAAHEAEKPF